MELQICFLPHNLKQFYTTPAIIIDYKTWIKFDTFSTDHEKIPKINRMARMEISLWKSKELFQLQEDMVQFAFVSGASHIKFQFLSRNYLRLSKLMNIHFLMVILSSIKTVILLMIKVSRSNSLINATHEHCISFDSLLMLHQWPNILLFSSATKEKYFLVLKIVSRILTCS